jgi:hypothetical protein
VTWPLPGWQISFASWKRSSARHLRHTSDTSRASVTSLGVKQPSRPEVASRHIMTEASVLTSAPTLITPLTGRDVRPDLSGGRPDRDERD